MKKQINYILSITLLMVTICLPLTFIVISSLTGDMKWLMWAGGTGIFAICAYKPLTEWRIRARQEAHSDEFGNSKRMQYARLSQKERDQIDLQKTADMERIVGTSTLKKLTAPGSENPQADLEKLIGLASVKQKVSEMAAKMEFEKEEKKKQGKNYKSPFDSGHHAVYFGAPGTGKAQPLYSKVLTPNGFVKMGDIQIGDKIISATNKVATVLGVYPQGKKPIYELTFDDGSTCRCSDEHLWTVQTRADRLAGTQRTVMLKDMLNDVYIPDGNTKRKNYSVDYVPAIDFPEQELYIHPYLLGALLGDGHLTNTSVEISVYDDDVRNNIRRFLPSEEYDLHLRSATHPEVHDYNIVYNGTDTYHPTNGNRYANLKPLNYHLDCLGLRGLHSDEKFIPKQYLYASVEQRRWLLRGLLDTDGFAEETGVEYCTNSEKLRDDVIELVHSLGGYASFSTKQGQYTKNGLTIHTREYYRIRIQFSTEWHDCFGIERKSKIYQPKRSHTTNKRYIADIQYVGEEECQCIYIDDPSHLYITDNYIITHNTTLARIMTGFLYQYGYIKENKCVEVDGNFLKAGAETATKTTMVIRQAFGGVLFVDEAYALIQGDRYGQDAVATLIKQMEDNRGRFVLILAGYTNEMRMLLEANPGFESRIKEYLFFEDYNDDEMIQIFKMMAAQKGYSLDAIGEQVLKQRILAERPLQSFGNARTARSILDEAMEKHAYHVVTHKLPDNMRYVITSLDISPIPRTIRTANNYVPMADITPEEPQEESNDYNF